MIRIVAPLAVLAAVLVVAQPVYAGSLTRSFVSSTGIDSNPCTVAQPCATFAAAYAAVAAGGIVAALDPGKYGPLTITGAVTINGNGWSAITAPASGNGVTVSAGTSAVTLIGLEIDGNGGAYNGIYVNSAGSLTVTNCILQNFVTSIGQPASGNGILMQAGSAVPFNFAITNTTVSNNGFMGIYFNPPSGFVYANGVIDHVVANGNQGDGIIVNTSLLAGGSTIIAISHAITSDNHGAGIAANNANSSAVLKVSVDSVTSSGNGYGIVGSTGANVLLGRSVITGNASGVYNGTTPSNTFYTYKDNRINLNIINDIDPVGSALNTTLSPQ
jgi:hypothetical protein